MPPTELWQIFPQLKNLQIFFKRDMKNEEFQVKVLLKQNTEMATKLQWYRRENQELSRKNVELNTWVENLSEVFAAVAGAWQSITSIEQTLLTLMKKKSDMKDKTVLGKYISHFKAFSDIINNLGEKIKNPGHSDQSAVDARTRLNSFVKNYEMFFREFVDTYFKFNEQYSQTLNQLKNKPEIPVFTRSLVTKQLENRQKIKEFETFMNSFKENFKIYQAYNQDVLLNGIIKQKEEEINQLKTNLYQQERRFRVFFDYNNLSIEKLLEKNQEDLSYECYCGGQQLQYTKKVWEEGLVRLKESSINGTKMNNSEMNEESKEKEQSEEKYFEMEKEKNLLIDRNAILLEKIEKMKNQYKVTDEMVLRSNAYQILKQQCQYLLDYCNDLMMKLRKNEEYLTQLEKEREEELKHLKKKVQRQNNSTRQFNGPMTPPSKTIQLFKTNVLHECQQLRKSYHELIQNNLKPEDIMMNSKKQYQSLKRDNEDLNKKIENLIQTSSKEILLEFRHERFKEIENKVNELIKSEESQNIQELWKEFIMYVKGRDKKIKDLESMIRKKQKEVEQKQKLQEIMKDSLSETQRVFLNNKEKLEKTQGFILKVEKELSRLAEENIQIKTQYEQQNNLLNLRLKAETDARNKLEEKVTMIDKFENQVHEIRETEDVIKNNYELWIKEQKDKNQQYLKTMAEQELTLKNSEVESQEKDKQLTKLTSEKQGLKSEIRQLKTRLQSLIEKSEDEVLKIQLEEYKGKIMCSCTGDRQREVALKTCSHLFCKKCIEETTNSRNRKCPNCGIRFTKTDIHEIRWN